MTRETEIEDLLAFWFGPLDPDGMPAEERHALWFRASDTTDRRCREQFGRLVDDALAGGVADWEHDDPGLVALVLLLDQLTRNIYRGSPTAFAGDSRARELSLRAIAGGRERRLPTIHRVFLYMPLMHAEDIGLQRQCVSLFRELAEATGAAQVAGSLRFAEAHCEVIRRFGRFPHRNAILGRDSTPAELDYLSRHGGF